MIRCYKRKLILNKSQEDRISSWIGACRLVYNLGKQIKDYTYQSTGRSISGFDLAKQLTELKLDFEWIKDVPCQSLQASIERLQISYDNFFRTYKKGGGYPKYATKKKYRSILFKKVKVIDNFVFLPKIGKLKMFKDGPINGLPNTATIIKESDGWFICIQCKNVPKTPISENQAIGIDMGIKHLCISSNGDFISNPNYFKKYERLLRVETRSLSRKLKGSASREKQKEKVSKIHLKIKNCRKDFIHKETTRIAKKYHTVYLENLNIRGMSKNQYLSKYIMDAGWGIFKTMLEYKTKVVKINPMYTSQTCSKCGNIDKKSRISQSLFKCTTCGYESNADLNAAKNINREGISKERKRKEIS